MLCMANLLWKYSFQSKHRLALTPQSLLIFNQTKRNENGYKSSCIQFVAEWMTTHIFEYLENKKEILNEKVVSQSCGSTDDIIAW